MMEQRLLSPRSRELSAPGSKVRPVRAQNIPRTRGAFSCPPCPTPQPEPSSSKHGRVHSAPTTTPALPGTEAVTTENAPHSSQGTSRGPVSLSPAPLRSRTRPSWTSCLDPWGVRGGWGWEHGSSRRCWVCCQCGQETGQEKTL